MKSLISIEPCLRKFHGYTLLEALLAAQLLALALIMISKVLIVNMAKQQDIQQHRMAVLFVYSAQALQALSHSDPRWGRWQAQLKHFVPDAKLKEQAGSIDICWKDHCLLERRATP